MKQPKTKVVFARLTIERYRELAEAAKNETRTDANMIVVLISEALEARKSRSKN
jgi:hypothetical protein